MTAHGPASAFILVGGRDLSSDTFTLSEDVEQVYEQTNGLGTAWEEHKPVELARVMVEAAGGLYDDRVGGNVEALQAQGETGQFMSYGMAGKTQGALISMLAGILAATWKRLAQRDGLTKAHAVYKTTGDLKRGRIIHPATAETSDPGNNQATSVDNSTTPWLPATAITSSSVANPSVITTPVAHNLQNGDVILISGHSGSTPSLNGGNGHVVTVTGTFTFTIPVNVTVGGTGGSFIVVSSRGASADLHVLALVLGGFTNVAVDVRHSADNVTFATLMSFAAVTVAPSAQRVTTASLVNRYRAIQWDFTGAGSGQSITPYVALS